MMLPAERTDPERAAEATRGADAKPHVHTTTAETARSDHDLKDTPR
ncbi:hypothetical protein [Nesterenkonia halotolerans]|uniref:Uncharacterized protein n=1 Tax=Nesterenkonia halotolerans TaxID=225325 RepID=A0ABR9J321_9MICC|nr:hypothetical protein [Nesterenkonia halotolerans]MBE1513406.1 hypothetical protein [Nesterenkonia halotolerans]